MGNRQKSWIAAGVLGLLMVMVGQIVFAIRGESLTWDEGDHIFAGYESWKKHDYGLNPEHPPMVKMVATLPLLGLKLKVPELQGRFFKTESYMDGRELLFRNGPADGGQYGVETLVLRVRLFAMVFAVAAALLVFAAGCEMFGWMAGLMGLAVFCFEPSLLAHGAYVTTDMAASCTIFATVYAFWRWVKRPGVGRLLVVGLAAGLALAAKHSTVLLLPILVMLACGELLGRWFEARDGEGRKARWGTAVAKMAGALAAVIVVGVVMLWAWYGFRYSARPAGLELKPTLAEYVGPLAGVEARGILLAGKLRVLPESWLYGLADVRAMANGMPSYFFGKVYEHGVWFYFPVLLLIKTTLGMLGLLAVAAFAAGRGWLRGWREMLFLVGPPALYLVVAMRSHLNIGARHVLPVWVFACVLAGAGAAALVRRGGGWKWVAALLLVMHAGSTMMAAPNYLSYANEAWGGPTKTYRYLTDSNTDWAQELVATSRYLRERGVKDCWIAYFAAPFLQPEDYGIPCRHLPTFDSMSTDEELEVPPVIEGTVLISAGDLNGFEFGSKALNPYEAFRGVKPVAFIQNGIFVFEGKFPVALASAIAHVQRSGKMLKAKDFAGAVVEARTAEGLAPGEVPTEMALGDALVAAGDKGGARMAYEWARRKIETMEPEAREQWLGTVDGKEKGL